MLVQEVEFFSAAAAAENALTMSFVSTPEWQTTFAFMHEENVVMHERNFPGPTSLRKSISLYASSPVERSTKSRGIL